MAPPETTEAREFREENQENRLRATKPDWVKLDDPTRGVPAAQPKPVCSPKPFKFGQHSEKRIAARKAAKQHQGAGLPPKKIIHRRRFQEQPSPGSRVQAAAELTVPESPKLATTARMGRAKPKPHVDLSGIWRKESTAEATMRSARPTTSREAHPDLVVPESPKFATMARLGRAEARPQVDLSGVWQQEAAAACAPTAGHQPVHQTEREVQHTSPASKAPLTVPESPAFAIDAVAKTRVQQRAERAARRAAAEEEKARLSREKELQEEEARAEAYEKSRFHYKPPKTDFGKPLEIVEANKPLTVAQSPKLSSKTTTAKLSAGSVLKKNATRVAVSN